MPDIDINWAAVVAATVANMLIGAAWYSPLLFATLTSEGRCDRNTDV